MYKEYRRHCKTIPRQFNVGDAFLWKEKHRPFVFNLGTQERPGRYATYQAIEKALMSMMSQADIEGIKTIAIPRIGSGYGGLEWKKVSEVIEKVFENWSGILFVYEEYQAEKDSDLLYSWEGHIILDPKMQIIRIVFGILAIFPIALLINHIFFSPAYYGEDSLAEMAYMIFGVPILIFNFWVWGATNTIEFYFFGNKDDNI
jgi:hypothetical protein